MQILGLLGMYFDAAVVFVMKLSFFFQIGSGHTVNCETEFRFGRYGIRKFPVLFLFLTEEA
jgi:hypothetical protein